MLQYSPLASLVITLILGACVQYLFNMLLYRRKKFTDIINMWNYYTSIAHRIENPRWRTSQHTYIFVVNLGLISEYRITYFILEYRITYSILESNLRNLWDNFMCLEFGIYISNMKWLENVHRKWTKTIVGFENLMYYHLSVLPFSRILPFIFQC